MRLIFQEKVSRFPFPNPWDFIGLVFIFSAFIAIIYGTHGMFVPLPDPAAQPIDLAYHHLPYYALRTTLRMFIALGISLIFTFLYATLAAKYVYAEMVLIPFLDVLQSVPILGFLSFTLLFFLNLFPGSLLGAECAAIFAIFTNQAWNMAFSFYYSLRSIPRNLKEVAAIFHLSPWQKFWRLETPFAMPGLVWNMMLSMSGGWFFLVAAEAITVGDTQINLPGIGAYLQQAILEKRPDALAAAMLTMAIVILIYDQLLFRPMVAWSSKFKMEFSAAAEEESSWVLNLLQRANGLRRLLHSGQSLWQQIKTYFLWGQKTEDKRQSREENWAEDSGVPQRSFPTFFLLFHIWRQQRSFLKLILGRIWLVFVGGVFLYCLWQGALFVALHLSIGEVGEAILLTCFTLLRIVLLLIVVSFIWVPLGVWIGLRPSLAKKIQPLCQLLAAFPVNLIFPFAVLIVMKFSLNADIWLSPLIVFGTQWYILFNVIAGAAAFPNDLKEVVENFHIKGFYWWRRIILPSIFPYYWTGLVTAAGGSWNASIVAEYVQWGEVHVVAQGIGSYIAQATEGGNYPKIVLGIFVMCVGVLLINYFVWRPLSLLLTEERLHAG